MQILEDMNPISDMDPKENMEPKDLLMVQKDTGISNVFKNCFISCVQCDKTFSNYDDLVVHGKTHFSNKIDDSSPREAESPTLDEIKSELKDEEDWDNNSSRIPKVNKFKCTHWGCDKTFSHYDDLVIHEQSHFWNKNDVSSANSAETLKLDKIKSELKDEEDISTIDEPSSSVQTPHWNAANIWSTCDWKKGNNLPKAKDKDLSKVPKVPKYKCTECEKLFSFRTNLKRHVETQHFPERIVPLQCPHCPKTFLHSSHLKGHIRVHTGEKPYFCEYCPKKFAQQSEATLHKRTHTGEKPYSCEECGKSFTQLGSLKLHKKTHLKGEPKPYLCHECPMSFLQRGNLKVHMKVHTGEKPWVCSTCATSFAHSSALKRHLRIHTGEAPYLCSDCPSTFKSHGELTRHKLVHTGEKNYHCNVCTQKFSRSSHLKIHMESIHEGIRYPCDQCEYKATQKFQLQSHIEKIHQPKHDNFYTSERLTFDDGNKAGHQVDVEENKSPPKETQKVDEEKTARIEHHETGSESKGNTTEHHKKQLLNQFIAKNTNNIDNGEVLGHRENDNGEVFGNRENDNSDRNVFEHREIDNGVALGRREIDNGEALGRRENDHGEAFAHRENDNGEVFGHRENDNEEIFRRREIDNGDVLQHRERDAVHHLSSAPPLPLPSLPYSLGASLIQQTPYNHQQPPYPWFNRHHH